MENTKKKKVLIYVPEFPRISETFIEREISKLIERDVVDVTVFSLKEGSGTTSDKVKERTVYKRLSLFGLIESFFFALFRLRNVFRSYNLVRINSNRKLFGSGYLFLKSLGYARLFHKYEPNLIYAHFMSESSTICLAAAGILDCQFGISAHAKDILVTDSSKRDENAELVNTKIKYATFVSICNRVAYNKALEYADESDRNKIHLMYHGIDFDKLLAYPKKNLGQVGDPNTPVVFSNGRFRKKKGHRYLIDAAKIIKDRGFKLKVFIVGGGGDLYQETKKYIEQLGLQEQIVLVNDGKGIPFEEVITYYQNANVYTFPSINMEDGNSDGISNSLIEASVFKVPIVTTDAGSTLEFIQHDISGLVVPQKHALALADNIEKLLFDHDLASKLAQNAHEKARKMFDIDRNIEAIEKLLL